MPAYPNPYGPLNDFSSGMRNIARSMWGFGTAGAYGRMGRRESAALESQRQAAADKSMADVQKTQAEQANLERDAELRSPDAVRENAIALAGLSGLPRTRYEELEGVYQKAELPESLASYSQDDWSRFHGANITARLAAQNKSQTVQDLAKGVGQFDINNIVRAGMEGKRSPEEIAQMIAASTGKPLQGYSGGVGYSLHKPGVFNVSEVGEADIKEKEARANLSGERALTEPVRRTNLKAGTQLKKAQTTKVRAGDKALIPTALSKPDSDQIITTFQKLSGLSKEDFQKIHGENSAPMIAEAIARTTTPGTAYHRNPVQSAIDVWNEMSPTGGFTPKGGGWFDGERKVTSGPLRQPIDWRSSIAHPGGVAPEDIPDSEEADSEPAYATEETEDTEGAPELTMPIAPQQVIKRTSAPAPAKGGAGKAPPLHMLSDTEKTTFRNGQTWIKQGGKAVRIK